MLTMRAKAFFLKEIELILVTCQPYLKIKGIFNGIVDVFVSNRRKADLEDFMPSQLVPRPNIAFPDVGDN